MDTLQSILATTAMSAYLSFCVLTLSMIYEMKGRRNLVAIALICCGFWIFGRKHFQSNTGVSFLLGRLLFIITFCSLAGWAYVEYYNG